MSLMLFWSSIPVFCARRLWSSRGKKDAKKSKRPRLWFISWQSDFTCFMVALLKGELENSRRSKAMGPDREDNSSASAIDICSAINWISLVDDDVGPVWHQYDSIRA